MNDQGIPTGPGTQDDMPEKEIRIVLDAPNGVPIYWLRNNQNGGESILGYRDAINYMRDGMPFVIAVADPNDRYSHYESEPTTLFRV